MQLTIVGYILAPVFSLDSWWLVILYASFMMGVASLEAVSRPAASYKVSPHARLARPQTHHITAPGEGEIALWQSAADLELTLCS